MHADGGVVLMAWDAGVALDELLGADGALFHDKKGRPVQAPAPLAPLADTHGHLTHFRRHDPAVALARAALVGVRMLVVPLDPTDDAHDAPAALVWIDQMVERAAQLLELTAQRGVVPPTFPGYDHVPALVDNVWVIGGTHPYGAAAFLGREEPDGGSRDDGRGEEAFAEASHEALDILLASPRCVGVGEIGLDFGPYSTLGAQVQVEAFREQLRMAHAHGLPVELHLRDEEDGVHATGHDLALQVLREEGVPARGCDLHCYTSDAQVMEPFAQLGCYVAFGGAATFPRSSGIREAAAACPAQRILSETDSPYMAPVPLRGCECEPAMVAFTAACLADVHAEVGVGLPSDTYRTLWDNACRLIARL